MKGGSLAWNKGLVQADIWGLAHGFVSGRRVVEGRSKGGSVGGRRGVRKANLGEI